MRIYVGVRGRRGHETVILDKTFCKRGESERRSNTHDTQGERQILGQKCPRLGWGDGG